MRAAVVIEQCWHRVPGGTARAAIDQIAAVAATGQVDQVGVAARHTQPPLDAWRPGLPVRQLPLPRIVMYWAWHLARRPSVERATGPVDLIHATGYAIPPRTKPLIVNLYDLAWKHDKGTFTRNGVRFFEASLACVIDDADLVLCPSQATLEDCAAAGIGRDRLRHVPLGTTMVDVSDEEVDRVRRLYGLTGRYVLSVSTLEPRKNLPRLLDAFGRLGGEQYEDVTLVVVGPEGWGSSLAAPAEALRDRLRLTGFVPTAHLAPLYRGASVVCYPSLWEGFGLPVLDAMAAGAPVVTSAGTSTEELVEGGIGLAVDPHDTDAIAGALARVLDDDDLAGELRRAGRVRAAEMTWDRTAQLTVAAYEEALGR